MSSIHLILPDPHAHPDYGNDRADWIGELIKDLKPDVFVNLGDAADMPSLSSYDKGKRSFQGRSYAKDIASHAEFQERLWAPIRKAKKRQPFSIALEGNHEHRIERALDLSPELEGTIGFNDLGLYDHYDEVVRYNGSTPGITNIDGINYAHYFITGVQGRANASAHPAYMLNVKQSGSCIQGHTHILDYNVHSTVSGKKIMSMVAGCGFDYESDWAGVANQFYWRGVVILHDVNDGTFDPEFVSFERLRKAYG